MKKRFTAVFLAALLTLSCAATAFAATIVAGPQGSSGSSSASSTSGASPRTSVTWYDPYEEAAATIPQPPVRNDLVDYDLPFTCVYQKGLSYIVMAPTEDATPVSMSDPGEYFRYLGEEGDFYKILFDGNERYISKSGSSLENTIKMDPGLEKRAQLVLTAFNYLGDAYAYGGTSAATGFDCSGFLYTVFTSCGVPLGRSTSEQVTQGTSIDVSEIRPGDLIFYADTSGNIDHGAMYAGNGMLIHSHSSGQGVRIQSYNYRQFAPLILINVLGEQN